MLRTWKRGSDFAVREMITYALPVTGPGCAVSGKTISNLVSCARADGTKSKEYTRQFPQSKPAHRLFLDLDILHLSNRWNRFHNPFIQLRRLSNLSLERASSIRRGNLTAESGVEGFVDFSHAATTNLFDDFELGEGAPYHG